jgi:cell division protein FtsI/penicillin-binding protein 2
MGARSNSVADYWIGKVAKDFGFGYLKTPGEGGADVSTDGGPDGDASTIDLLENLKGQTTFNRTRPKGNNEGDNLYAVTGTLNLINKHLDPNKYDYRQVLAQTAIGQSMSVSPLQMARIAASIPSEKITNSFIVKSVQYSGAKIVTPETVLSKPLDLDKKVLEKVLKSGMKEVVTKEYGTVKYFKNHNHPDLEKIYGKTGTADTGNDEKIKMGNAAWFIGWREDVSDDDRTIAFSSWVSRAAGSGGGVAAPVIADIFQSLHEKKTTDTRAKRKKDR